MPTALIRISKNTSIEFSETRIPRPVAQGSRYLARTKIRQVTDASMPDRQAVSVRYRRLIVQGAETGKETGVLDHNSSSG